MAIIDRHFSFSEPGRAPGDARKITAFGGNLANLNLIGEAKDIEVMASTIDSATSLPINAFQSTPIVRPMYLNITVYGDGLSGLGVSDRGEDNRYVFALFTANEIDRFGNLVDKNTPLALSFFPAEDMIVGWSGSIPFSWDEKILRKMIQPAVGSTSAVADERGRFAINIGIDPIGKKSHQFPRGRN